MHGRDGATTFSRHHGATAGAAATASYGGTSSCGAAGSRRKTSSPGETLRSSRTCSPQWGSGTVGRGAPRRSLEGAGVGCRLSRVRWSLLSGRGAARLEGRGSSTSAHFAARLSNANHLNRRDNCRSVHALKWRSPRSRREQPRASSPLPRWHAFEGGKRHPAKATTASRLPLRGRGCKGSCQEGPSCWSRTWPMKCKRQLD